MRRESYHFRVCRRKTLAPIFRVAEDWRREDHMGTCASQTFQGVTQAQFDRLVQRAAASGILITGSSGSASKDGISVMWTFDAQALQLTIQCTAAPFWVGCGAINQKIHDLVDSSATANV
jgi:hypothetical protein